MDNEKFKCVSCRKSVTSSPSGIVNGLSPEDKLEERITLSLYHARLYLAELDDDWADKSSDENIFNISCGGGVSRSSL